MSYESNYWTQIKALVGQIQRADAIVIGGGSGLSSAAGYNHYHWSPALKEALGIFYDTYGFRSPFDGFYYLYSRPEDQWGYYSQYIRFMWEAPTGEPYLDLKEIVGNKPCFVLTTNIDMHFARVFREEQICTFQGDFGYCQCSQPCHDKIYNNHELIEKMHLHLNEVHIPNELIPRCQECGRIMVPWVRDDTFLEGEVWKSSVQRYQDFLRKYLLKEPEKKVLLLELGVGEMTPSIIKLPFWEITAKNKNVFYACINQKPSSAPSHLKGKSLYIAQDIKKVLQDVRNLIEEAL